MLSNDMFMPMSYTGMHQQICNQPRGYKTFSMQISAEHEINAKMPAIVGILTSISIIHTRYERLKARHVFICRYFSFYELLKYRAQLS